MKEQFCTYEIALALKELGFNEGCFGAYRLSFEEENEPFKYTELVPLKWYDNNNHRLRPDFICTAPLWQQAWSFLNDEYRIFITIALVANGYGFYIHKDFNTTNKGENYGFYPTIYEAREAAILKAIELCQKEK